MLVHWQATVKLTNHNSIRCHHCHSQTDSGRKLMTQCSKCYRPFHLSCIKKAINMKSLVNQKLSDFNIKGALQILSGDSFSVNPSKESLDILQQKHLQAPPDLELPPSPSATTPPRNILQSKPNAACNLFLPPWLRDRPRRTETTTFERLHINLCR